MNKYAKLLLVRATPHDTNPTIARTLEAASGVFDQCATLCWDHKDPTRPEFEHFKDAPLYRFGRPVNPRWKAPITIAEYQAWVFQHILRIKPSVVQAFDVYSLTPAILAARIIRAKVIYDVRDPLALSFGFSRLMQRAIYAFDWSLMALSSAMVVPDESRVDYLGTWKNRKPVIVVHNTCRDMLGKTPALNLPETDRVRISYVGYLTESRGGRWLIEFCQADKNRCEMLAAGASTPASLAEELRECENVRYFGKLPWEQTLSLTARADVSAVLYDPSIPVNRMAAPNKVYESLMLGTPLLVAEGMQQAQWVRREKLGYVVRYGDENSLREAVEQIADRPAHEEMRKRCRDYYLNRLTLDREIGKYRDFYVRLMQNHPSEKANTGKDRAC